MKINVVYGDEAISEDFLIEVRKKGHSIGDLFNNDVEYAAETFIDIARQMDYSMGDDYLQNLGKLCIDLSKKYSEFYECLVKKIKKAEIELTPRAAIFLYGL